MTTSINIINTSSYALTLTNSVSPTLAKEDYGIEANDAPESEQTLAIMWFNRNDGITEGDTWMFTTAFTLDGVDILLQEKVTGTLLGSSMAQAMTAGGETTEFQDTNDPMTLLFSGASGAQYALQWQLTSLAYKDITYTVTQTLKPLKRIPPIMQQIETVVFMMLENRSLDTMLGWLYNTDNPAIVYPPDSCASFDGLPADAVNEHDGTAYRPTRSTGGDQPCRVPQFDPAEPMPDVKVQLYADGDGNMPSGYVWATTPPMKGFAFSYDALYDDPTQVMGTYSAEQLPVLYGLAENYAVSDAWFCSVPTQTYPNRAFSVCGTSLGAEVNGDIDHETYANADTIFNVLGAVGKTWGLYWQTVTASFTWGQPATSYYYPKLKEAENGRIADWDKFLAAAKAGTLPNFCFLEPYWGGGKGDLLNHNDWVGIQGNDYHPPAWIGPAEADLNALYEALIASPQWDKMLLIITFDEHGGTYDHVPPPTCVAPDEHIGPSGFDFKRLGVRVPTILVSRYIQAGTVFRAPSGHFDHTSFLSTLCQWAGVDPASAQLGSRVATAPSFGGVLSESPRTDIPHFTVPADYASQGGGTGTVVVGSAEFFEPAAGAKLDLQRFREEADGPSSPAEFANWLKDSLS